ncbi:MAG: MFS transporter [Planctomycetota bacterium]
MKFIILFLLCLMAVIAYIQRAAISVPEKQVAEALQLTDPIISMGWVQSAWYLGYAILQMPAGRMADRLGAGRTIVICSIIWSLLTACTGFSTNLYLLLLTWFLMGSFQAAAFPCAARSIRQVFADDQRARASGILAAGMMIGGALAPLTAGHGLRLLQPWAAQIGCYPWQLLLGTFAIPGLLWAFLFSVVVPQHRLPPVPPADTLPLGPTLKLMASSAPLFLLCTQQFLRAAAMVFFLTRFPRFLQETRGVNLAESANLTSVAGFGGVLGSLSGGLVSDAILRYTGDKRLARQGLAAISMLLCSLLILASIYTLDVRLSIALITLGVFCASFGGIGGYTVAIDLGGRQTATVFSLMNMCGNFGSMLFPITAGWLVKHFDNWNVMMYYFAAIMALDAVCWTFINPRGSLFPDPPSEPSS